LSVNEFFFHFKPNNGLAKGVERSVLGFRFQVWSV